MPSSCEQYLPESAQSPEKNGCVRKYHVKAPFGQELLWALHHGLVEDERLSAAIKNANSSAHNAPPTISLPFSDKLLEGHLRWRQVADGRSVSTANVASTAGIVSDKNGFYGYSADAPNPEVLQQEQMALAGRFFGALFQEYRMEGRKRAQFLAALYDCRWHPEAMHFWNSVLGAELGKLRAQVFRSPELLFFRHETQAQIATLPPLQVVIEGDSLYNVYQVVVAPVLGGAHEQDSDELHLLDGLARLCSPTAQAMLSLT